MKKWFLYKVAFPQYLEDLILAEVSNFDISGIESIEGVNKSIFKIYFNNGAISPHLESILKRYDVDFLEKSVIFEEDWGEKWKENFKGVKAGDFYVIPPWKEISNSEDFIEIFINPGSAFGTGLHETTQLCLQIIPQVIDRNLSVLDCGCGSCILMIASYKFGKKINKDVDVYGLDVDENSIGECKNNFSLNGIGFLKNKVYNVDVGEVSFSKKFDLIFANMLYNIIERNLLKMKSFIKIGGVFVFSGILKEERDDFERLLKSNGFSIESVMYKGEWLLFKTSVLG